MTAAALAAIVRAAHRRIAFARFAPQFGTPLAVIMRRDGWICQGGK